MLIGNGTAMHIALDLSSKSVSNPSLILKLNNLRDAVSSGKKLPAAVKESEVFDLRVASLIAVGDEANQLASVTRRAADLLTEEVQRSTKRFFAVLTPALSIAMGLLVGGLVVSVMTALLSINEIAVQ